MCLALIIVLSSRLINQVVGVCLCYYFVCVFVTEINLVQKCEKISFKL